MKSSKRLGVGFVGSGFNARFHMLSWTGVRDADVVGVWSPTSEHARSAAAYARSLDVGPCKAYRSITDMIRDPAIDALWICAPNQTRLENLEEIADAITRGRGELRGIACEKPLARNVKEALRMVELARQAGLQVENGIVVDEFCATPAPDVFAAGDVASFPHPALAARIRVEHEDNANTMGRAAGRTMAGDRAPYQHLPFFYSDLFDLGYEAVGELDPRLNTFADWVEPFRQGVVYYLKDGRVRGVLLWNTWGQVDAARALIMDPGPFTANALRGRIR